MYINMHGDAINQIIDNEVRGHECICTLNHTKSSLVLVVWSGVSMIELNQYHVCGYNQSYYI